jgi:hypothetical protein
MSQLVEIKVVENLKPLKSDDLLMNFFNLAQNLRPEKWCGFSVRKNFESLRKKHAKLLKKYARLVHKRS